MNRPILHQFTDGAAVGDAITDQALAIRTWLHELGFESEIFAAHIHPALEQIVRPVTSYRRRAAETHVVYHHSIGSDIVERLCSQDVRLLLIYHNVTPPEFFHTVDPALANQLRAGIAQLESLRPRTDLALADSPYNEGDLSRASFATTGVLPIVLDEQRYAFPPAAELVARYGGGGPLLLFVGRITPNKRQEDLVKLLYYYRRIRPDARLVLVGARWLPMYADWLQHLARSLGLADHVILTDHVTQQEMVTFYQLASLYISMSEHEGFGKPLIESMYLGLPVLAYAAASVPGTMGGAGVLFHRKDFEALAELVDILIHDTTVRQRIIDGQHARARSFLAAQVKLQWTRYLATVLPAAAEGVKATT
ncbi:MAG: glycosyltransferase family 4 protein [Caldilineaceae bacterium]|nr:glycosyltransferase family 4 protein [Caldilineaceae bacterium]